MSLLAFCFGLDVIVFYGCNGRNMGSELGMQGDKVRRWEREIPPIGFCVLIFYRSGWQRSIRCCPVERLRRVEIPALATVSATIHFR